ncbi:MAG: class I SAM-dependent methyltransferase [Cyclobacteriaceae bacterium]|nr:class I SAM-dependent methyltransferase [Cyclobacteriaceae bacterium]
MSPNDSADGHSGFRAYFSGHTSFRYWDRLFYQSGIAYHDFEREYTSLRTSEGRMLPDAIVKALPYIPRQHPHHREWAVRRRSANALARYLKKRNPAHVLEIGCGNGWLTNYLVSQLKADCCGIDINEFELKQAARLFLTHNRITFVHGDIVTEAFSGLKTDVVVCASVIQYFADMRLLIDQLRNLLRPGGEIHIMDSPLYREDERPAATSRSVDHFRNAGHAEMASYYHHHTWQFLKDYPHTVLHDPSSLSGRIKKWLGFSPFPWIVIRQ